MVAEYTDIDHVTAAQLPQVEATASRDGFWTFLLVSAVLLLLVIVAVYINSSRQLDQVKSNYGIADILRPYVVPSSSGVSAINKVLVISDTFDNASDSSVTMRETGVTVVTSADALTSTLTGAAVLETAGTRTPWLVTDELSAAHLTITDPAYPLPPGSESAGTISLTGYYFPGQQDFQAGLCLGSVPGSNELAWIDPRLYDDTAYGIVTARRWARMDTLQNPGVVFTWNQLQFDSTAPAPSSGFATNSPNVQLVMDATSRNVGLQLPVGKTIRFYMDAVALVPTDFMGQPLAAEYQFSLRGGGLVAGGDTVMKLRHFTIPNAVSSSFPPGLTITSSSRTFLATVTTLDPVYLQLRPPSPPNGGQFTLLDWNIMAISV